MKSAENIKCIQKFRRWFLKFQICTVVTVVGVAPSNVAVEDAAENRVEQTKVGDTEQNTSPLSVSEKTAAACDETCRQQENATDNEPQHEHRSELEEPSDQKEAAAKETESSLQNEARDSGPVAASEAKEEEQRVLSGTQTSEAERIADDGAVQQTENWKNLPVSEQSESGAGQAAEAGNDDSQQMSQDQAVVCDAEESLKRDEQAQQGGAGVNLPANEKDVKPEGLSDEQRALSHL